MDDQRPFPLPLGPSSDGQDVVFLLGAGASVDANIPAMADMYDRFVAKLVGKDAELVTDISQKLTDWAASIGRQPRDVEILLAALERYARLSSDLGVALTGQAAPQGQERANDLAKDLKSFIRNLCLNTTSEDVHYLHAFVRLANLYRTLDVFSLNYDLCMELAAKDSGIFCETGFGLEWEPDRLRVEGTTERPLVRLYKLHGSVTWYRTDDYRYMHIPVRTSGELLGIDGSPLQEMIVYPELEKEPDLSPYPNLLGQFRSRLAKAGVLVVIGYAFGDKSLPNVIHESMSANPGLHVIVVDHNPKEERLERWDAARVCYMRKKFKEVLDSELLQHAIQDILAANRNAIAGARSASGPAAQSRPSFRAAVGQYLSAGHVMAARETVRSAQEMGIESGKAYGETLMPDFSAWADGIPGLNDPTCQAWLRAGKPYLGCQEHAILLKPVVTQLAGDIPGLRDDFFVSTGWSGLPVEEVQAEQLVAVMNRLMELRGEIPGKSMQSQALEYAVVRIKSLLKIHGLSRETAEASSGALALEVRAYLAAGGVEGTFANAVGETS